MVTIEFYLYLFAKISVFLPPENILSQHERTFVLGDVGTVNIALIQAPIGPLRPWVARAALSVLGGEQIWGSGLTHYAR